MALPDSAQPQGALHTRAAHKGVIIGLRGSSILCWGLCSPFLLQGVGSTY